MNKKTRRNSNAIRRHLN